MAKYCRYCNWALKLADSKVKCIEKNFEMTTRQSKHTNQCKSYKLNVVDVLRENSKGYVPTGKKIVQYGGKGVQIKIEDIAKEMADKGD